ncbi:MAG: hypothetical protein EZS28_024288 [Streblomastix strix]|uniref:Uncharacterized protein n=1 Tax=Streblomastix strix TaxID=222440 RepID=A0A5J4VCL3_9EUKA|nr:MAG: hypothetical protein EZS28_024288 [Streblomastix strix]
MSIAHLEKFGVLQIFQANLLPFLAFGPSGNNISCLDEVLISSQLMMFLVPEFRCSNHVQGIEHFHLPFLYTKSGLTISGTIVTASICSSLIFFKTAGKSEIGG